MLQWKRGTDHCQGVYAQPRHFRHYDARDGWIGAVRASEVRA